MPAPTAPPRRTLRRRLVRLLVVGVGIYLVVMTVFIMMQRSLVYPAARTGPLTAADHPVTGARLTDVTATTGDGVTLHGWHARPAGDDSGERPVVLVFHGNGGNRRQCLDTTELFCGLGAEVLLFDYRGYGENAGEPTEDGLTADARAVWEAATETLGRSPEQIVLYGESLGGGVAVRLAADLSEAGTPPAGLIVCNTFTSLVDVAAHRFRWLPVRAALLDRFESLQRIGDVTCPILVLHGDADTSIPQQFGRRLFGEAPERSSAGVEKRFVSLPGAGHNDMLVKAPSTYRDAVGSFVVSRRTPSAARPAEPGG